MAMEERENAIRIVSEMKNRPLPGVSDSSRRKKIRAQGSGTAEDINMTSQKSLHLINDILLGTFEEKHEEFSSYAGSLLTKIEIGLNYIQVRNCSLLIKTPKISGLVTTSLQPPTKWPPFYYSIMQFLDSIAFVFSNLNWKEVKVFSGRVHESYLKVFRNHAIRSHAVLCNWWIHARVAAAFPLVPHENQSETVAVCICRTMANRFGRWHYFFGRGVAAFYRFVDFKTSWVWLLVILKSDVVGILWLF